MVERILCKDFSDIETSTFLKPHPQVEAIDDFVLHLLLGCEYSLHPSAEFLWHEWSLMPEFHRHECEPDPRNSFLSIVGAWDPG